MTTLKKEEPRISFGAHEGKKPSQVLESDPGYIVWMKNNFPENDNREDVQLLLDMVPEAKQRKQAKGDSEHVSREGHRDIFDVRASKFQRFEKRGVTKAVFVMRDTGNNRITAFLGRGRRSQKLKFEQARRYTDNNQSLRVEADVARHKEYRGEPETVIKNVVVRDELQAPIKPSAGKGEIRLLEENKSRVRNYRKWVDTFLGRVRKAVKVRRKLEDYPFSDDALKRLTKTMATLADVHSTKQEQYKNALDYVQSHPSVYS